MWTTPSSKRSVRRGGSLSLLYIIYVFNTAMVKYKIILYKIEKINDNIKEIGNVSNETHKKAIVLLVQTKNTLKEQAEAILIDDSIKKSKK